MSDQVDIFAMRRAGFTYREIAEISGKHKSSVRRICIEHGVEPEQPVIWFRRPNKRKLDGREEEVNRLYWDEGLSLRQAAERLGVSDQALLNFMYAKGIPRRDRIEATKARFASDNPPRRSTNSTRFDSESGRQAVEKYWAERRRRDRRNQYLRDRRAKLKAAL